MNNETKSIQEMTNDVIEWNHKNEVKKRLKDFLDVNANVIDMIWNDCLQFDISPLIIFRNSGDDSTINFRIRAVVDSVPINVVIHHDNTYEIEVDA